MNVAVGMGEVAVSMEEGAGVMLEPPTTGCVVEAVCGVLLNCGEEVAGDALTTSSFCSADGIKEGVVPGRGCDDGLTAGAGLIAVGEGETGAACCPTDHVQTHPTVEP